jgi:hypothetical protein
MGKAHYAAQRGETDPAAKPMRGFRGARVMETVDLHGTNTRRAMYTAQFGDQIPRFRPRCGPGRIDGLRGTNRVVITDPTTGLRRDVRVWPASTVGHDAEVRGHNAPDIDPEAARNGGSHPLNVQRVTFDLAALDDVGGQRAKNGRLSKLKPQCLHLAE